MSIIGAEDEDFENDLNEVTDYQCKYFNSIELLKERPTHLLVFIQHVILQFDPAPLLCYLHAELLKNLGTKEIKKQFMEFNNTFLDKGAILRVMVPSNMTYELDRSRADLLPEDVQKRYAQEVQALHAPEVAKQLEDFRQKRMMGMTPNETELIDVENHYPTDRIPMEMKEKSVAENLMDKMFETQSLIVAEDDKCHSIYTSVAIFMKHLGVKSKQLDSKKSKVSFFGRNKQTKTRQKEESTRTKPRVLYGLSSWIGGNPDVKPKTEAEAEKEKVNPERKGSTLGRGSLTDPAAPFPNSRKSVSSGSAPTVPGPEISDSSASAAGPEVPHTDVVSNNRLEPPALSDGGDVSPISLGGGLTIGEPLSPTDTPMEENVEKDSFDSLVLPPEGPGPSPTSTSSQLEEMEPRLLEFEADSPNWRELAPPDCLSKLSKKEIKRQEVINELFATEHAHVRMLSVLQMIFSKPLEREELLTSQELAAIFPNLDELIEMHYHFYENLKKLRLDHNFIVKSISTTVLNRFGGTEGEWFQKLTARFCSHQSWALDQIKSRQKREPRFNSFILDAESKPQCRRLQLKDIIPIEMQRLTKYPLLLENIAKSTEDPTEKERIQQSAECCKRILNHVNEEVKEMENLLTLKDYQRRLDTSGLKPSTSLHTEYKNMDLSCRKMLYEGPVTWRVTKEKAIEVQCVLLSDMLVLLQKQDDKMVLKCHSKTNMAAQESKQMLSPIIKLNSVFLRDVATDRKAFYVIFTWDSGAQIYELVAQSLGEKKLWTEVIKSAVDDLKKGGGLRLMLPPGSGVLSPTTPTAPLSPTENGGLKNDGLKSSGDPDKDILTDDKSSDHRHMLIDFLSDKGFDLIGHSNSDRDNVASSALDEVMSLKRLVVGSISLSDESQQAQKPGHEMDICQSTEETQTMDKAAVEEEKEEEEEEEEKDKENSCEVEGAETKAEEERSISAPLVLSQERMQEVCRRLHSLEEKVKSLQTVEEEHHRLQEALSQFSLEGGNFH